LDEESTARLFLSEPGVNPDGIFFLAAGDHYVATATDKRLPQSEVGYLHMVAVAPRYRGRGFGRCISLAALNHMRDRACLKAVLDTDDFRLPAIATYLALSFVPDMLEADYVERWRAIFAELGAARPGS
jgi:mycothiol synthase